jgi:hypothetical protein
VTRACGDPDDVRPAADIALPVVFLAHSDHRAVSLKSYSVKVACADTNGVRPAVDIALPIVARAHGDRGTLGFNSHCVMLAAGDLGDRVRKRFKRRSRLSTAYYPGN